MDTFTVILPKYDFKIQFDYTSFIKTHPDSLITRALDQTGERNISIDNSIVTPYILQLLESILSTQKYPYIPEIKPLDYLGIDLPKLIYNHKYKQILSKYPEFALQVDMTQLDKEYRQLLDIAVGYQADDDNITWSEAVPELAQYIFNNTNPTEHRDDDCKELMNILSSGNLFDNLSPELTQIAVMLLRDRDLHPVLKESPSTGLSNGEWVCNRICDKRSPELIEAYVSIHPESIDKFSIVGALISSIGCNALNYEANVDMINRIEPYIGADNEEFPLYLIFQASSRGNIDELKQLLPNLIHYVTSPIGNPLLYTALVNRHYDVAKLLIDLEEQNKYNRSITGQLKYGMASITGAYISRPEWVTPEGLQLLINNYGSLYSWTYKKNLQDKLKDYPDLALIVQPSFLNMILGWITDIYNYKQTTKKKHIS